MKDTVHEPAKTAVRGYWSSETIPLSTLLKEQGIDGPQGLAAFSDPEWQPGIESDRFLEALFIDVD